MFKVDVDIPLKKRGDRDWNEVEDLIADLDRWGDFSKSTGAGLIA